MGLIKDGLKYQSDGGRTSYIANMTSSHLINAIAHHRRQVDAIEEIMANVSGNMKHLKARLEDLEETIIALEDELIERDPADDAKYRAINRGM